MNDSGTEIVGPSNGWASRSTPMLLAAAVLAIGAPALLLGAAAHFYLGMDSLRALSFWSNETALAQILNSRMEIGGPILVGIHLFGDFALPYYWVSLPNPWLSDPQMVVDYTPPVLVVFKALAALGPAAALGLFLLAMVLCLLAPCWLAMRGQPLAHVVIVSTAFALVSGPALACLDRGNTQGFLPLLLFGFAYGLLANRWWLAAVCLTVASLLKVVPILLVVFFIARRQWLWAAVSGAATLISVLVMFPIVTADPAEAAPLLLRNMLGFGVVETSFATFMDYNVSMLGGLAHLASIFTWSGVSTFIWEYAAYLGALYFILVLPLLLTSRIDLVVRLIMGFMCLTAVVPIAYPYALSWTIAGAALLCGVSLGSRGIGKMGGEMSRPLLVIAISALALLSAPYPFFIPGSELRGNPSGLLALVNVGVSILAPICLYVWLVVKSAQERSQHRLLETVLSE